jgi:hypothetical protein
MRQSSRDRPRDRWRPLKDAKELDPRLPGPLTGIGDIVLDDAKLEQLVSNDRIRKIVIRREVKKGTVIPIVDKGYRFYAEPIRRVVFGRPVKSMNSMLADVMIELNKILHPERTKRLEA